MSDNTQALAELEALIAHAKSGKAFAGTAKSAATSAEQEFDAVLQRAENLRVELEDGIEEPTPGFERVFGPLPASEVHEVRFEDILDIPAEIRGPGTLVVIVGGEAPSDLRLGPIFAEINIIPAFELSGLASELGGNACLLSHGVIEEGRRCTGFQLEVAPAAPVIGLIKWLPRIVEPPIAAVQGLARPPSDDASCILEGLPAGARVLTAVVDNWQADYRSNLIELMHHSAVSIGMGVYEWRGAPAGDFDTGIRRTVPTGRLCIVGAAWDARDPIVPRPPIPEPPPPPPPPPPTGDGSPIPVDTSAAQDTIEVAPVARHVRHGHGFGLGSSTGQSSADTLGRFSDALFDDLGTGIIRINNHSLAYMPSIKLARSMGCMVHLTGYGWVVADPKGSARRLVDGIDAIVQAGGWISSACPQNEPTFRLWTDDQARAAHLELRLELDRRGYGGIQIVSPEFANTDGETMRGARLFKPLLDNGTIHYFGHHAYGLGVDRELASVLGTSPGCQGECGNVTSMANMLARVLNDTNCLTSVWIAHRGHQTDPKSEPGQNLIAHDGTRYPWWFGMQHALARALPTGTPIHRCTMNGAEMVWKRETTSRVYAAAGKRNGRWTAVALCYKGATTQPTFKLPEKLTANVEGFRLSSTGSAAAIAGRIVEGALRFPPLSNGQMAWLAQVAPAGETLVMGGG